MDNGCRSSYTKAQVCRETIMNNNAGQAADNRRAHVRVAPDPKAPVRVNINGDGFIEVTSAVDISEGGIRISVRHRFAGCHVDQPASFIIHLPEPINKDVSFRGRIKHVLNDSFGVQFTTVNEAGRALIRRYVELRLGKPVSPPARPSWFRGLFGLAR
jgi:hypothetical protein